LSYLITPHQPASAINSGSTGKPTYLTRRKITENVIDGRVDFEGSSLHADRFAVLPENRFHSHGRFLFSLTYFNPYEKK